MSTTTIQDIYALSPMQQGMLFYRDYISWLRRQNPAGAEAFSEIVMALLAGAALYLETQPSMLVGQSLLDLLYQQAITLPPSVLAALPDADVPHLQSVISAGEACSAEIVARWGKARHFLNAYGPTEATVCATIAVCMVGKEKPSIGHPIANAQVYLLDGAMQMVPIGVTGELYIGGIGLARGYLHRPDLTCERFLPHPFSDEPGARLYKTGDLARYRADGSIEYIGRQDDQVKIRAYRIELGEIEYVLEQHPQVRDVVVLARDEGKERKRLVAYVVLKDGEILSRAEMRAYLQQHVPDYMIPAFFVQLERLPLNANGKVDRRALPDPEVSLRIADRQKDSPPRNETEQQLLQIWEEVLGVEGIGIHDNYFTSGGASILSIQIISRANQAGIHLTPRQIFQYPTIAELASAVDTAPAIVVEQGLTMGEVPLTPIQHWFFEQEQPDPHHWNQAVLLRSQPQLDRYLVLNRRPLTSPCPRRDSPCGCLSADWISLAPWIS